MDQLQIGDFKLYWLNGGQIRLDGGAMFGVVPKTLWTRHYPCNDANQIILRTDPILIQAHGKNLLIESGMGNGKLTEKQLKNYGVMEESGVGRSLQELGLTEADIDYVLMTHMHFDHACGLSRWEEGSLVPCFPNAVHLVNNIEWEEIKQPNIRSRNTYWEANWQPISDLVQIFDNSVNVLDGIEMIHTGGHSHGHAIIRLQSNGEIAYHFADIMPTHAHRNPLWVMAYDDYPMDSIFAKERLIPNAAAENAWIIFYHDPYVRAIKWDQEGSVKDKIDFMG